jgi:hypothetical protein
MAARPLPPVVVTVGEERDPFRLTAAEIIDAPFGSLFRTYIAADGTENGLTGFHADDREARTKTSTVHENFKNISRAVC